MWFNAYDTQTKRIERKETGKTGEASDTNLSQLASELLVVFLQRTSLLIALLQLLLHTRTQINNCALTKRRIDPTLRSSCSASRACSSDRTDAISARNALCCAACTLAARSSAATTRCRASDSCGRCVSHCSSTGVRIETNLLLQTRCTLLRHQCT
jgi:hypothetical protein